MKKTFLLSLAFITVTAFGQNAIPNGNFETWNTSTYDYPQNYQYTSNTQALQYQLPVNVTQTNDAYHGQYAVQLTTNASATDTNFAYFLNINPNAANGPSTVTGGMPYNQKPTGIRGWYKYNVATADSGTIIMAFSKAGVNIGTYLFHIGGIHSTYTLFNFTFNPALSETPDSVAFGAFSCKINASSNQKVHGIAGSTLKIDSVSFTGVSSQPALMNGDFESWQSQTSYSPADWYTQNNMIREGYNRTTDAAKGNYAIELTTYLGNQNDHPAAQSGEISTGYYPNNCNGNCNQLGGYPFSNKNDTLAFYYKYAPSGNDSAWIQLNYKNNGSGVDGKSIFLHASKNYQYVEFPCGTPNTFDTVIVQIQSSSWLDTLLSFVGSDLKIDEIHFKSQPLTTGISNYKIDNAINIYPNPAINNITIEIDNLKESYNLEILNTIGQVILNKKIVNNVEQVDLSGQLAGIYFVKLQSANNTIVKKIIKQ